MLFCCTENGDLKLGRDSTSTEKVKGPGLSTLLLHGSADSLVVSNIARQCARLIVVRDTRLDLAGPDS